MKTKTDEVDAGAKTQRQMVKWYAVRPLLLVLLVAETLLAAGLIAIEPGRYMYWADRVTSAVRIGLVEIESGLVCLAVFTIASIGFRAREGERASAAGCLRRYSPEG